MNYSKPEVKTLGEATSVIQGGKLTQTVIDAPALKVPTPAYDLDE